MYEQENFFFDGQNGELSAKRCVMRLRFFNVDEKAVLTVKGKMIVSEGVGRAQEDEDEVDVNQARTDFLRSPSVMLDLNIAPIKAVKLYALTCSIIMCRFPLLHQFDLMFVSWSHDWSLNLMYVGGLAALVAMSVG